MGLPHEPLTRLEIEDYLSTADAFRDSYTLVPRENQFGRDSALETFRAFVADPYARLKATLRDYARLRAALTARESYLAHMPGCGVLRNCAQCGLRAEHPVHGTLSFPHAFEERPCTCGLAALLKEEA